MSVVIALLTEALLVPVMGKARDKLPDTWVRVVRVGGTKRNIVTDYPMVTCECWGMSEVEAEVLAMQVSDILESSPGEFVMYPLGDDTVAQAWICDYNEIGGPASNPDPDYPKRGRWTLTVELGIASNL